jgi:hypothetical protein
MEKILEQLMKSVDELQSRMARLEATIHSGQGKWSKEQQKKKLSVKEFLRSQRPQTDVHKVLAIGYYLEKCEEMSLFNVNDIKNGLRAGKESIPSNTQAFINQNIKNGHIMECPEKKDKKKAYVLTNSGEEFVENGFNRKEK